MSGTSHAPVHSRRTRSTQHDPALDARGLLLSELHRRAGEAATTVPLAHSTLVHPQDTADLLFSLGQPQLPDALAPASITKTSCLGEG
jgi:hypothetical protein